MWHKIKQIDGGLEKIGVVILEQNSFSRPFLSEEEDESLGAEKRAMRLSLKSQFPLNMDAPQDSNLMATPFSNSEDSYVFNYMSELSPIKPDKPVHHNQALDSSSFCSPPSVFTSPHVSHRNEQGTLHSHTPFLDSPKPNISFDRRLQISSGESAVSHTNHAHHDSNELQENTEQGNALVEQLCRKCTLDMPQGSAYDCGSPSSDETISIIVQGLFAPASENERPGCDWEGLTPNETDTLEGLIQKSLGPTIRPGTFTPELPQNTFRNLNIVDSQHEIRYHTSQPEAATETEHLAVIASNLNERMDDELFIMTNRHTPRRSLNYDMAGMQRKDPHFVSNTTSRTSQSLEGDVPTDKWLVPTTGNVNSHMRILPGTNSRLNRLPTLKDSCTMSNGWPPAGQFSQSTSAPSLHPSTSQQRDQISHSSMYKIPQRELHAQNSWTQPALDYSQSSALFTGEGFNRNSSNRKRRKSEPARGGEGCKHCKCKVSNCLKLYCECFASRVYCMGSCFCRNCFNKPIYKDTVLAARREIESRNPLAFAPKVITNADSLSETGVDPNKTPASTRHRRGCNCKKSGCQKKYCECYQNGVGCSIRCRCGGCKNEYGRNYGSSELRIEAEIERNESCEMLMAEKSSQITETLKAHPNSAAPSPTPSGPRRAQLGGSSRRRPPSNFITPAASTSHASQRLDKKIIAHSESKFEYNFQNNPELEVPNVHLVIGDGSSVPSINDTSNSVMEIFHHSSLPFPSLNSYQ